MAQDRAKMLANLTKRQKITAVIVLLVIVFIIWQIISLMSGGSSPSPKIAPTPPPMTAARNAPIANGPGAVAPPPIVTPQSTPLPAKEAPLSPREVALIKLQQETEEKYIAALNELQMLKVQKEIANANREIWKAKQDTITAEKSIVEMLKPAGQVTPEAYARGLGAGTPAPTAAASGQESAPIAPQQLSYTVISVSELQHKWRAVIGVAGKLYSVAVGDVLPPDGSKIVSITRDGVEIEKDGQTKKLSLVSII